jgi:hypothetical protein
VLSFVMGLVYSPKTSICVDNCHLSSFGLMHGNTPRQARRLSPSRPSGVRHQAAPEGVSRRAPQAPGADFSVRLRRLRGGPEGIQREPDHVHLLVNYPPKLRLSELVNSLKGVSSRRMKQEFPAISTFWSIKKVTAHCGRPATLRGRLEERLCQFCASINSAPVYRGAEPASGRCALNPQP